MARGAKFRELWQFVRVKNRELWHGNTYHIGVCIFMIFFVVR